jgi:hypothetical protein
MAAFRIHLAGHPLLLTFAVLAALGVARLLWRQFVKRQFGGSAMGTGLSALSLVTLVTYVGLVVFYATDPHYFDAAEPTMTAVGWLFHIGQPIYHSLDSAERYAHIYGPMAFIAHGVALGMFGPSIEVSKWVGGAMALGSLGLIFTAVRTQTSVRRAMEITGMCALLMLAFKNYSFWTRAEPLLIFCVSAGLVAGVRGRGLVSAILLGVFAGLLWNLKATGLIYSLPLFVLLFRRLGWGAAVLSVSVAAVTSVLPFVALPNVSFSNYVSWFRLSANNGLLWPLFTRNVEWAAWFLLPLILTAVATRTSLRSTDAEWRPAVWAMLTAMGLVVIAGSKPGAGPYHLLPLLPVMAFLIAQRIGQEALGAGIPVVRLTLVSIVVVAAAIALVQQVQFVTTMQGRRMLQEIRDIETFVAEHPGVVEMGYGVDDPMTFERPVLVFRNNAYLLDAPAVGEHQLAGLGIPPATLDALRQCRVNYWLVPKGEAPFTSLNMYPAVFLQPVFPDEFRRVFHQTHTLIATTEYFDAWQCHQVR